ncbi:MAG: glycosyltransferase family 39 protein [Sumerlaeia bacterium]
MMNAAPSEKEKSLMRRFLLGAVAFAILWVVVGAFALKLNRDEAQLLSVAWHMAQGERLYLDIWDNHGPLPMVAASLWFRAVAWESYAILYVFRGFGLAMLLAGAWLLWRLARRILPAPEWTAPLTVLFYLASVITGEMGFQIRSDTPLTLIWIASLLLYFRARDKARWPHWLLAGAVIGLGFTCSVKTLILGFTVGLMFVAETIWHRRLMWKELLLYGAGAAISTGLLLLALRLFGVWDIFFETVFGQNFDREAEPPSYGWDQYRGYDSVGSIVLLLALAYTWVQAARRRVPLLVLLLSLPMAFLIFQFVVLLPTKYPQSLTTMIPPAALVCAWVAWDLATRIPRASWKPFQRLSPARWAMGALTVFALAIPFRVDYFEDDRLATQVQWGQRLLANTPPDTTVFDADGHPFFRVHPGPFKCIVNTIRDRVEGGQFDTTFPQIIDEHDIQYAVIGSRFAKVKKETLRFLEANYLPAKGPAPLFAAGKVIGEPGEFPLLIAGEYHWGLFDDAANPITTATLTLNGQQPPNPTVLGDGTHSASFPEWARLVIYRTPPENWGNWHRALTREMPHDNKRKLKKYHEKVWQEDILYY